MKHKKPKHVPHTEVKIEKPSLEEVIKETCRSQTQLSGCHIRSERAFAIDGNYVPIETYYSLDRWHRLLFLLKTITKIAYYKLRHPIKTYKARKAEIEKHKDEPSTKSKLATLIFCIFVGFLGGHRLYTKRYLTTLLYFCTFGLLFFGVLFDFVMILKNRFKDNHGRKISKWRVKGDVLALLVALLSIVIMLALLPRALATITFYGCKTGEYFNLIENGSCHEALIFDAFTSRSSGQLTDEMAPIVQTNKKEGE